MTMGKVEPRCASSEGAAIIGFSCQLPPAIDKASDLWDFISRGCCSADAVPQERFQVQNYYDPDAAKKGHVNVSRGSYLRRDVGLLDAPFFEITKGEATAMDPQQRLLLESVHTALENAGQDIHALAGSDVGVFAAGSKSDYATLTDLDPFTSSRYAATGGAMTMFANRVSYYFNFRGPSLTIDTACSSSLTALHYAVESLRRGECSLAIVGGSFLQLSPILLSHMGNLGTLSKDGISYSFDHRANGYGRGEGVCCIVLKLASKAAYDADTIRSIIRQTGVSHGGRSQGITFPNGRAQEDLIRKTYSLAGLRPEDTVFVEGHGTGTQRGDPIEAEAIMAAFAGKGACRSSPIYLGSIKSNFGHLEAASGLLSVIKCVLMLEAGVILPNANFEAPHPDISSNDDRCLVPTECVPWPDDKVRRTSINNFGFGGSNAHVIMEQAPLLSLTKPEPNGYGKTTMCNGIHSSKKARLFCLSAKDQFSLSATFKAMTSHLEKGDHKQDLDDDDYLERLSHTLCCRRSHFDYRFAVVATSRGELIEKLSAVTDETSRTSTSHKVGLIFTGQGAQWPGMGVDLMKDATFSRLIYKADRFLLVKLGADWSLLEEISRPSESSRIGQAQFSQPAVTAVQIGLVEVLRKWRIGFVAVCGHSSGEIAAAYASGHLSFEACLALAYFRGDVAKSTGAKNGRSKVKGAMLAVGVSASIVEPILDGLHTGLATVACYNSPESVTISGDEAAILELKSVLDEAGIFNRILKIDTAYHSDHTISMVERYLERIRPWLKTAERSATMHACAFYSSVTGTCQRAEAVKSPWYWVTNLVSPVQFASASASMISWLRNQKNQRATLVEIGPHSALGGPLRETAEAMEVEMSYASIMKRNTNGITTSLEMAAALIREGASLDATAIFRSFDHAILNPLTDLPSYRFNLSERYWHSSRTADASNFRGSPWNVLLGHEVTPGSSAGGMVEYRNVFSLDDIPWLRDHRVNGCIVFPMAGYVSMAAEALAIEAVKSSGTSTVRGYTLEQMSIEKPLLLHENTDHEMFLVLRTRYDTNMASSTCTQLVFEIRSWSQEAGFSEHCRGLATIKRTESADCVSKNIKRLRESHFSSLVSNTAAKCDRPIAPSAFYRKAAQQGLAYGPSFSLMSELTTAASVATGVVQGIECSHSMPAQYENRVIVHPTMLDAALHVGLLNLGGNKGLLSKLQANVPVFINRLFISSTISQTARLRVFLHHVERNAIGRSSTSDLMCFVDGESMTAFAESEPCIDIQGLRSTDVSESPSQQLSDADAINPAQVEWLDHPDFLSCESAKRLCSSTTSIPDEIARLQRVDQLACQMMQTALKRHDRSRELPWHLAIARTWMESTVAAWSAEAKASELVPSISSIDEDNDADEKLIYGVGSRLHEILDGSIDALTVLQDSGLTTYYEKSITFQHSAKMLAELVGHLSYYNPSLHILEIGAGTGGFTARVLEQLDSRFASYDFTDISPAFLPEAKERFRAFGPRMTFRTLDIGRDPALQGLEADSFDLIIAADVVHATTSVHDTLSNIRMLSRPSGILALVELSAFTPMMLPFTTLPGWWSRPGGPILSKDEWLSELRAAHFNSVKAFIGDLPGGHDRHCVIWAQAGGDNNRMGSPPKPVTVLAEESTCSTAFVVQESLDPSRSVSRLEDVETSPSGWYICFEDVHHHPILTNPSRKEFQAIQRICVNAKGILWVASSHSRGYEAALAEFAFGFARTIRSEHSQLKFVVLNVVDGSLDDSRVPGAMISIFRHAFVENPEDSEVDFKWQDGRILFPRLVPIADMHAGLDDKISAEVQPFWRSDRNPVECQVRHLGALDSLYFDTRSFDGIIGDEEVLIEVRATGLNFKDVLIVLGRVPWSGLGKECSGIIRAAGKVAQRQLHLQPGDAVIHWGDDLFASHVRCHMHAVVHKPENLDFLQAASVPVVFATAYQSLVEVARLEKSERLLIHAAAGGVGQAAIIIGKNIGAEIYCTVGTQDKREFLIKEYGIFPHRIFSSRTPEFAEGLRRATDGEGVDVVLNSLCGDMLHASWKVLRCFGRFVEIGKKDALAGSALEMAPFDKGISYSAVDLSLLIQHRPKAARRLLETVLQQFASNDLKPVSPLQTYSIADLSSGLRLLQSGKHVGKVIVENKQNSLVCFASASKYRTRIRADASYLITGGTGGLGRSLAEWLIQRGAKHIIMASRSAGNGIDAQRFADFAKEQGATVLLAKCDVSVVGDIQKALQSALCQGMPPVRGIIHGAMVLKDCLFESVTYEDWTAVQQPKIQGAINLCTTLDSQDLDFFLNLSSIASLTGNIGQSSYSGSNAVLDALCHSVSIPMTTVNLPAVSDVGYVAEALLTEDTTAFTSVITCGASLSEAQVLGAVDAALGRKIGPFTIGLSHSRAVEPLLQKSGTMFRVLHWPLALAASNDNASPRGETAREEASPRQLLAAAADDNAKREMMRKCIHLKMASILMVPQDILDCERSIADVGLDSLLAVELRNWMARELEATVPVMEIVGCHMVRDLFELVIQRSGLLAQKK